MIQQAVGTQWAGRAQLTLGALYALEKNYAGARDAYALVLQNYNGQKELCLNARVAIAKTYEFEKNWPEAIKTYQAISEYHPWSVPGLEAPLYVARLYEQRQQTDEAAKAYERAARAYTKLIVNAPNADLSTHVKGYLALAYQRLARWDEAVKVLEELANAPTGTNRPLVLMTLGAIYQTKLHHPEKAQALYSKLVQEFPDNPFGQAAKAQLERMDHPTASTDRIASPTDETPSSVTPPTPVVSSTTPPTTR